MAFRLLRFNGYDVSSGTLLIRSPHIKSLISSQDCVLPDGSLVPLTCVDPLTQITEGKHESSFSAGHLKHIGDALELYRASEIIIYPHESALEEQHSWSSHFLKEKLNECMIHSDRFNKYVSQEVTSSNVLVMAKPI